MSLFRRLQNRPPMLERAYSITARLLVWSAPLLRLIGLDRVSKLFIRGEQVLKGAIFDCQMCGECVLHETGMTCSMTCPKNLRNGPCGGVRMDGTCEIKPEMECVWVQAWARAENMPTYGKDIMRVQPPLDKRLQGTSAWLNMLNHHQSTVWISVDDILE